MQEKSKFQMICHKIEGDKNFGHGCPDDQLLYMSAFLHNKCAIAIDAVEAFNGDGKLFYMRFTMHGIPPAGSSTKGEADSQGRVWYIMRFFNLVGLDGTTNTYSSYNYKDGILGAMASGGWGYDFFLNRPCLHDKRIIPFMQDFQAVCAQIEKDENFCPEEHLVQELEELSCSVKKGVTAISEVKDFKDDFYKLARLFQVMSTCYGHGSDTEVMPLHWYSNIAYILVKPSGKTEVYMSYKDGVLDSCILDKSYCEYLGHDCVREGSLLGK